MEFYGVERLITIARSLGLVEVLDSNPQRPALKQVAEVKGVGIGSTMIDRAFEVVVQKRIDAHPEIELPDNLAHKLARSPPFQSLKHKFGTSSANQPVYILRLDKLGLGISRDLTHLELGIENGRMRFSRCVLSNCIFKVADIDDGHRSEIQALFDTQIKGIASKISKQLDWMQTHRNRDSVVSGIDPRPP